MDTDTPQPGLPPAAGRLQEAFEQLAEEALTPADAEAIESSPSKQKPAPQLPEGGTLEGAVEAMLLVAHGPARLRELCAALGDCDWVVVRRTLRALQQRYARAGGGLELIEIAGGWRLVTRALYAGACERLQTVERAERMTSAQLEVLALIAYKQPATRAEVDTVRGADSSGVLRTLLEKGLVRICGRADQLGRPFIYGTTNQFLERFGLKSISDLPKPRRGVGSV